MTEPQMGGTYDDLLAVARWAESAGLASIARSDHYFSGRGEPVAATDAFATLAGLARDTATIRLCVLVSPITFRHPAVIAKNAATIDQMSGGRLDLGVGTGWMDLEHDVFGLPFPPWSERFDRLEETLQYLDAAFTEGHGTFTGAHYALDGDILPKPTGPMPIIVGGSGPKKTPALAGRFADEYNHFVGDPETLRARVTTMRAAASEAGRDPESIIFSAMGMVVTGRDEAEYRDKLAEMAAARDMEPIELEDRYRNAGLPVGPPDRVREVLSEIAAAGVTKYYLQFFSIPTVEEVEVVVEAVRG